uniref:ABC transporter domain-containing protein n=1 Tax=Entomoneis paludosa TaxID=265537 RepID=A0A7S2V8J9_9STRA|mmetsp:Transcript_12156/g.25146  ORF Transcript_12156/g.25146 Transcript_12156/m.25146 type:complete len:461 (+) Transcript_12156:207-1589(+)
MAPRDISNTMDQATEASGGTASKGCFLRWSRLTKTVAVKDAGAGLMGRSSISMSFANASTTIERTTSKDILKEISGYAAPGEVLACMGPSGSGKTSLMNVLSGRSSYQGGVISINGVPSTQKSMKRLMSKVAYVRQADIFFGHLTVRDQLTYTALLRMPAEKTTLEKHQEVDKLIRLLRLSKVADSQIMMVSGGEKKRVNIATELLTDPEVLLLDEPTSGLDSTTAVSLIKLLQEYALQQGKTVITSIHQPSSQVFRSFDRLMMLSDGYVVYFGTPVGSIEYLRTVGLSCPDGYNAADHWMDLLVVDTGAKEEEEIVDCDEGENTNMQSLLKKRASNPENDAKAYLKLQNEWDREAVAEEMDTALVESADDKSLDGMAMPSEGSKYNSTWTTQYSILVHRALKNSRSAILTPLNLIKSIGLGLATGLIYWQTDYTEQNVQDIRAYFFFNMTFWVFDAYVH